MPEFKIIKGGLPDEPTYKFIDAFVTDTRLMGVLGLRVHWLMYPIDPLDIDGIKDIYHFYYFDYEELGLDSIKIFELADDDAIRLATKSCFGGLGANMMMVSEKEARYLINFFIDDTIRRKEELPKALSLCQFVREEKPELSTEELANLNYKTCTGIETNYGAINYYLMRQFGKDFEGASFLKAKGISEDCFDDISVKGYATFIQNTIEDFVNPGGSISYLCESLVQTDRAYYIVTSEFKLANRRVTYAKKRREFEITIEEASMITAKPEFVNLYKILIPMEDFDADFAGFSIGTTRTEHSNGDMYLEFKPDNSHVEEKVFKLNADLNALFFVTDTGELLIGCDTLEQIREVEHRIMNSPLVSDLFMIARTQFANEIVFEFAQSGFGTFEEFIQTLNFE